MTRCSVLLIGHSSLTHYVLCVLHLTSQRHLEQTKKITVDRRMHKDMRIHDPVENKVQPRVCEGEDCGRPEWSGTV